MSDIQKVKDSAEKVTPKGEDTASLSDEGISAIQGDCSNEDKCITSAQKGSEFENRSANDVFSNRAERKLNIHLEDNTHLDKYGNGLGISKAKRIPDAYVSEDGELWELKSGYEDSEIDRNQLYEYSLMEQAGHVYVREEASIKKVPVNSINYLFETKGGACANASYLKGLATVWFLEESGDVKLLDFEEEKNEG